MGRISTVHSRTGPIMYIAFDARSCLSFPSMSTGLLRRSQSGENAID